MKTTEKRINEELLKQFLEEKIVIINSGAPEMLHAIIKRVTVLDYPDDAIYYWITNGKLQNNHEADPAAFSGRELMHLFEFFRHYDSANADENWNITTPKPATCNSKIISQLETEIACLKKYIIDARRAHNDNISASIAYIELIKEAQTHRQKTEVAYNAIELLKSRRDNNPFPWEELPF